MTFQSNAIPLNIDTLCVFKPRYNKNCSLLIQSQNADFQEPRIF